MSFLGDHSQKKRRIPAGTEATGVENDSQDSGGSGAKSPSTPAEECAAVPSSYSNSAQKIFQPAPRALSPAHCLIAEDSGSPHHSIAETAVCVNTPQRKLSAMECEDITAEQGSTDFISLIARNAEAGAKSVLSAAEQFHSSPTARLSEEDGEKIDVLFSLVSNQRRTVGNVQQAWVDCGSSRKGVRYNIISLIACFQRAYSLPRLVLTSSGRLLDLFLSQARVSEKSLPAIAAACTLIISKLEVTGDFVPSLGKYANFFSCCSNDILKFETIILNQMNWAVRVVSSMRVLEHLFTMLPGSFLTEHISFTAVSLIDNILYDESTSLLYDPAVVALSALTFASAVQGGNLRELGQIGSIVITSSSDFLSCCSRIVQVWNLIMFKEVDIDDDDDKEKEDLDGHAEVKKTPATVKKLRPSSTN